MFAPRPLHFAQARYKGTGPKFIKRGSRVLDARLAACDVREIVRVCALTLRPDRCQNPADHSRKPSRHLLLDRSMLSAGVGWPTQDR
jgi:hypothetical protein